MHHDEKHLLINNAFAGKQRLMSFFNRSNNEYLILAIQSAGVSNGRNSFRKDKSGEKLAESDEYLLEHCTDGTDAFDTHYIGCEKFPFHDSFSLFYVYFYQYFRYTRIVRLFYKYIPVPLQPIHQKGWVE